MPHQDNRFDVKSISLKYCTDVPRLIRAWKKGTSDREISSRTGIDPDLLSKIRNEIKVVHRQLYMEQKVSFFARANPFLRRYFFPRPPKT